MRNKIYLFCVIILLVFLFAGCCPDSKLVYVEIKKIEGDRYYTHSVMNVTIEGSPSTYDLTESFKVFGVYSNGDCVEITDYVVKIGDQTISGTPSALNLSEIEIGKSKHYHVYVGSVKSSNYLNFIETN